MPNYGEGIVHPAHPQMWGYGDLTARREGNTIIVTGTARLRKTRYAFGYHYAAQLIFSPKEGDEFKSYRLVGDYFYIKDNNNADNGRTNPYEKDFEIRFDDSREGKIGIRYLCCGQGSGTIPDRCDYGYGHYDFESIYWISSAYRPPQITLETYTPIVRKDSVNAVNVVFNIEKGTANLTQAKVELWEYGNSNWIKNPAVYDIRDSGRYTKSFTLGGNGISPGSRYRLALSVWDTTEVGVYDPRDVRNDSRRHDILTYTEPTLNWGIIDYAEINPRMGQGFTIFGTNQRNWPTYEDSISTLTKLRINNIWETSQTGINSYRNHGNNDRVQWNTTDIFNLIPPSSDGKEVMVHILRANRTAGIMSNKEVDLFFRVYYRPQNPVENRWIRYTINNQAGRSLNQGETINNNSNLNSIYVSWDYDINAAKAGYTEGYRLRLYNKDNQVVKTYYTTNKSYTIPKEDIPKLQVTYLDIVPYFRNNQSNVDNYWYGTNITKVDFIKISSDLAKPVITYPVNNSTWMNTDFRVCFEMPIDPDNESIGKTNYRYDNIELKINDNFIIKVANTQGDSVGAVLDTNCIDTPITDIWHNKNTTIYPKLVSNFPLSTRYKLQIRVKKKYGVLSNELKWSEWSEPVYINIQAITYNFIQGNPILASEYNQLVEDLNNYSKSYDVEFNKPASVIPRQSIINANNYLIGNILTTIKNKINNWSSTAKQDIKVDKTNKIKELVVKQGELITADNENLKGRNYIGLIYESCKLMQ